jgi:hypothetical protein
MIKMQNLRKFMRLLLNFEDTADSLSMLEKMKDWDFDIVISDSNMEDTYNFRFENIDFFLMYDRNSAKNKMIYKFVIESHAENAGEGTDMERKITLKMFDKLIGHVEDIVLENDGQFENN